MHSSRLSTSIAACSLVFGIHAIIYGIEKMKLAGGSHTTVGEDIVVLVYVTTIVTTLLASLSVVFARRQNVAFRILPIGATLICAGAFAFWTWLHLSGTVISYSQFIQRWKG